MSTTSNHIDIAATPKQLYKALTEPAALAQWMAPDAMTAKVQDFDLRVGGGYAMSLYYPEGDEATIGKSAEREDRYTATYLELVPDNKIVLSTVFDTDDDSMKGEMIMEVVLTPIGNTTRVTVNFRDIPVGIKPEDNIKGTQSSLEKLAAYVAHG